MTASDRKICGALAALITLLLPPQSWAGPTNHPGREKVAAASLIDQLADAKATPDQKEAAKRQIAAQGRDAIPALIDHLGDARAVRREDVQNYYNLPPNHPTPPPVMANVTVGQECEKILYDLITPNSSSSTEMRGKPFSASILKVADWKAWWAKNKGKSLEEIHKDLQPLVDRYWKEQGTEQVVR